MNRSTNIEVYRQIEEEGLLSKMRWETYKALFEVGPATAGEVSDYLTRIGTPRGGGRAGPGNVSARLVELQDLKCVRELGTRECRITRREVILWDVTDQLPQGKVRKSDGPVRPPDDVMRAALKELRAVRDFLKQYDKGLGPNLTKLGKWMADKYETKA